MSERGRERERSQTSPESMANAESRGSINRRVTSGEMRSAENLRKLPMAAGSRTTMGERATDVNNCIINSPV